MDHDRGAVVEIDDQVLGAPADALDNSPPNMRQNIVDALITEDPGEIADMQRVDALTNDLVDQRAADGFDFREFWHTRTTDLRSVRNG